MATKQALINNSYSDEWYTPADVVRTMIKVFPPKTGDRILLPLILLKVSLRKSLLQNMTNMLYGAYEIS